MSFIQSFRSKSEPANHWDQQIGHGHPMAKVTKCPAPSFHIASSEEHHVPSLYLLPESEPKHRTDCKLFSEFLRGDIRPVEGYIRNNHCGSGRYGISGNSQNDDHYDQQAKRNPFQCNHPFSHTSSTMKEGDFGQDKENFLFI